MSRRPHMSPPATSLVGLCLAGTVIAAGCGATPTVPSAADGLLPRLRAEVSAVAAAEAAGRTRVARAHLDRLRVELSDAGGTLSSIQLGRIRAAIALVAQDLAPRHATSTQVTARANHAHAVEPISSRHQDLHRGPIVAPAPRPQPVEPVRPPKPEHHPPGPHPPKPHPHGPGKPEHEHKPPKDPHPPKPGSEG